MNVSNSHNNSDVSPDQTFLSGKMPNCLRHSAAFGHFAGASSVRAFGPAHERVGACAECVGIRVGFGGSVANTSRGNPRIALKSLARGA